MTDDELDGTQPEYAIETITGLLPDLSVKVFAENFRPEVPKFPRPVRLAWADLDVQLNDAELRFEDGTIFLKIVSQDPEDPFDHHKYLGLLNEPAVVELEDGSTIWCPFAHLGRTGMSGSAQGFVFTVEFSFSIWEWLPGNPCQVIFLGIGETRLPGCADNLWIEAKSKSGRGHFRGVGRFTWHVLNLKKDTAFLVEGTAARECAFALGSDLMALEYAFGADIALDVLWLVDSGGSTVGGVGLERRSPINYRRRCPAPSRINEHHCWAAPLFRAVAAEIGNDDSDLSTVVTGYMDALRVHIHGGYLLAQVALEAFCAAKIPKEEQRPLVTDTEAWRAWVAGHEEELRGLCPDATSSEMFLNRLRHNAVERPKGEAVKSAFHSWGIALPPSLKKEIGKRGKSAHAFIMFDEIDGDVQEASDRVEMVQTMLTAAIAKSVGYKGQIAGWERDSTGHQKPAEFWPSGPEPEALLQFLIGIQGTTD